MTVTELEFFFGVTGVQCISFHFISGEAEAKPASERDDMRLTD